MGYLYTQRIELKISTLPLGLFSIPQNFTPLGKFPEGAYEIYNNVLVCAFEKMSQQC
jgi:hypothetical protein